MSARAPLLLGLTFGIAGCVAGCLGPSRGAFEGSSGDGGAGGGVGGTSVPLDCTRPQAAPFRARLLSPAQYAHAVEDLFGLPADVAGDVVAGFAAGADARLDELGVEQRATAAAAVAHQAVLSLRSWAPCDPARDGATACRQRIVDAVGRRAFRRPLAPSERAELEALFEAGTDEKDFATGVEWFLTGLLQAPDFLYQLARPDPEEAAGRAAALGPFETASRLAFFLWDSIPDDDLLAAAGAGALAGAAGVRAQADRMLRDPRFLRGVESFYGRWLALDRFAEVARDDAGFTTGVAAALRGSLLMSATALYARPAARLADLFSGEWYYLDGTLRAFYGLGTGAAAGDFVLTAMPGEHRRGLLTHPGLMALLARPDATNPIARGLFVRRALLCQDVPPPTGIDVSSLPAVTPGLSGRDRLEAHVRDESCAVCHQQIDPPGFAFEAFDQVGRTRAADNGKPVDSSGVMLDAGDLSGPFGDGDELLARVAGSADVAACFARQYLAHALARALTPADACSVEAVRRDFVPAGDLRQLAAAVAASDAFRLRLGEGAAAP